MPVRRRGKYTSKAGQYFDFFGKLVLSVEGLKIIRKLRELMSVIFPQASGQESIIF